MEWEKNLEGEVVTTSAQKIPLPHLILFATNNNNLVFIFNSIFNFPESYLFRITELKAARLYHRAANLIIQLSLAIGKQYL